MLKTYQNVTTTINMDISRKTVTKESRKKNQAPIRTKEKHETQLLKNEQPRRKGFLQEDKVKRGSCKQCHRKNNSRQAIYHERLKKKYYSKTFIAYSGAMPYMVTT